MEHTNHSLPTFFFFNFFLITSCEFKLFQTEGDDKEGDLVRYNLNPNSGENFFLLNVEGGRREMKEVDSDC